jgi:hypothetical protein
MKLSDYITKQLGTDDWAVRPDTRGAICYPASTRLITVAEHDQLCARFLAQGGKLPAAHQRIIQSATRLRTGRDRLADPADLPAFHARLAKVGPDMRRIMLHGECLIGRGHWYRPEPNTHQLHQITYMGVTGYGSDEDRAAHQWMLAAGQQARAMRAARRDLRSVDLRGTQAQQVAA